MIEKSFHDIILFLLKSSDSILLFEPCVHIFDFDMVTYFFIQNTIKIHFDVINITYFLFFSFLNLFYNIFTGSLQVFAWKSY